MNWLYNKILANTIGNQIVNSLQEKFGEYFDDCNLPIEEVRKEIIAILERGNFAKT
jgi:hypothetical protein